MDHHRRGHLVVAVALGALCASTPAQTMSASTGAPVRVVTPPPVNAAGPSPFLKTIATVPGFASNQIAFADVNGDQVLDLLRQYGFTVAWNEHLDGAGTFGAEAVITTDVTGAEDMAPADFDGDGDVDVAVSKPSQLWWYENQDGLGDFGTANPVAFQASAAFDSIEAADLDTDGDQDILTAAGFGGISKVRWHENRTGTGTFNQALDLAVVVSFMDFEFAKAADIDGDGDLDVYALANPQSGPSTVNPSSLFWIDNVSGTAAFSGQIAMPSGLFDVQDAQMDDLDLDTDLDVVLMSAEFDGFGMLENTGGGFGPLQVVPHDEILRFSPMHLGDMDMDGDVDVLGEEYLGLSTRRIVWAENTDGLGTFPEVAPVSEEAARSRALVIADVDLDGVVDAASSRDDGAWAWYTHATPSTWKTLGGGSPGVQGVPRLDASGPLTAGSTLQLTLNDAAPNALLLAWVSTASTPFPALGGTVHAFPVGSQYFRVSDGTGAWSQSLGWPAGIPSSIDVYLQFLVQDASVPAQITLSNAETATTP